MAEGVDSSSIEVAEVDDGLQVHVPVGPSLSNSSTNNPTAIDEEMMKEAAEQKKKRKKARKAAKGAWRLLIK